MKANGPDQRLWTITRRPEAPGALAGWLPGRTWLVEAVTDDEERCWQASSRRAAGRLMSDVALALRTGGPGPAGERAPARPEADGTDGADGADDRADV